MSMDPKKAFEAVDGLCQSWALGSYVHHVRHVKDRAEQGHEFLVIFSMPQPTKPVPELVATATFTVKPRGEGEAPKVSYIIEKQKNRFPGERPIRKQWLDAAIRRKAIVLECSAMFADKGRLPQPLAFVPGKYKAAQAIADAAFDGADENQERLMEAANDLADAQAAALQQMFESDAELEQLLVSIFKDGDADGNGYLDPKEFRTLLETSQLGLDESSVRQILMLADANGDGKIEYAEFAPLGADIIQTMRLRQLNAAEEAVRNEEAELMAREVIHGLGEEEIVEMLLSAFRSFDKDNSGRLERGEIVECLKSLQLGATKLTPREIKMIMSFIDEDESGTIEYNEFAPLMFNYLVEALKLGFLQSESDDLVEYLSMHLASYDAEEDGRLTTKMLKAAMIEADLVKLTPIQLQTVLADAPVDSEGKVMISNFVGPAARMIIKLSDPALERKRHMVTKMAKITPLQAITPEEQKRLTNMARNVFQAYDADGSGKLDRAEFQKCLFESKLGLNEHQIQKLMFAADENDDGAIDYNEFADLFFNCMLEMTREQSIERMLRDESIASIKASFMFLLDELMIPLHLAFDIASGGQDSCDKDVLLGFLWPKCVGEWGVMPEAIDVLAARIMEHPEAAVGWHALCEMIEKLAFEEPPSETGAPAAA